MLTGWKGELVAAVLGAMVGAGIVWTETAKRQPAEQAAAPEQDCAFALAEAHDFQGDLHAEIAYLEARVRELESAR